MIYLSRYKWNETAHRFDFECSWGFNSRSLAELAARDERDYLRATNQNDISVRLELVTASGERIPYEPGEVSDNYADRAALGRLIGEGWL